MTPTETIKKANIRLTIKSILPFLPKSAQASLSSNYNHKLCALAPRPLNKPPLGLQRADVMAFEAQGFNYTVSVILGLQEAQDVYERNGTILTYRGVPL